ncbi:hypothetical protein Plec18167_008981 [Paecilomyces lecythidis]|uniref:Uncharacterized protein n=1 Tax=Paecilomyces lecythidis TaxID=3004212 RepID=A0ABR3WSJ5_9EURO
MWMSLTFQTLRGFHLDEFLPAISKRFWSGNHLNVALPLWQSFTALPNSEAVGGRLAFQEYLRDNNPLVRQWAKDTRDAFNDIRNSPDPALRKYYESLHQERRKASQATWEQKKSDNLKKYLSGQKVVVKETYRGVMTIPMASFQFAILRKLGVDVKNGDEVFVQFHLPDTPHPHAYTSRAHKDDPASRFAVSIEGSDTSGHFYKWLTTDGDLTVMRINSLVDVLEGYSLEESRSFKRRWHVNRMVPGERSSRKTIYT